MDRAKEAVRRSLLAVGRTALGQRALRFYADNGLVGGRSDSSRGMPRLPISRSLTCGIATGTSTRPRPSTS